MNLVVISAFEVGVHSEWGRTKSVSFGQRTQLDSWAHYPKENNCNCQMISLNPTTTYLNEKQLWKEGSNDIPPLSHRWW